MSLPRINHWLDLVFWLFFAGVAAFIVISFITMLVQMLRDRWRAPTPPAPNRRTPGSGAYSKKDETWSIGGMSTDSSVAFGADTSFSSESGASSAESDGGGDSGGGDFSGGGGESGGGGSSGGWND